MFRNPQDEQLEPTVRARRTAIGGAGASASASSATGKGESDPLLSSKEDDDDGMSVGVGGGEVDGGDVAFRMLDDVQEEIGVGRFQQALLAVCSFGAFVDAAETAMIALVLPELQTAWGFDEKGSAIIGSSTALGMMFGALGFGWLSDVYGRRLSYQVSLALCAAFGFFSSFADSIPVFSLLRFFLGIGYGGNLVASTSLLIEFTPNDYRGIFMSIAGIAFGVGALTITGLAWAVIPLLGWKWLLRIAAFLAIPVIVSLFFVPESPRFYIMTGQYDRAVEIVQEVARVNDKPLPPSFNANSLRAFGGEFGPGNFHYHEYRGAASGQSSLPNAAVTTPWYKIWANEFAISWRALTRRQILLTLIPLFFVWFSNNFASTIFWFTPLEISKKYGKKDEGVIYEIAMIMAAGDLLGCIFNLPLVVSFNRITLLRFGTIGSAITTLSLGFAVETTGLFIASFLLQFAEQITINTLYLYSPEVFPTGIRVRAFGICMFGHRIAPTIAPFAIAALDDISFQTTCIVMACVYLFAFFITLFLKVETFNTFLIEDDSLKPQDGITEKILPKDEDADKV